MEINFKKRTILNRLKGIQQSPNYSYSNFLQTLEKDLMKEYNDIVKQEEEYWKLKSRITWLSEGDANTKLIHITTLNRRRKN